MPKERKSRGARKNNDPLIKKPKPLGQEPVEHVGQGILVKDIDPSKSMNFYLSYSRLSLI